MSVRTKNEQASQRRWHCCDLSWWVILVPLSALLLNCTRVWGCNQTIGNAHNEKVRWRGCDPHCGATLMCACFLFSSTCLVVLTDTPLRTCWLKCSVHWEEKPIRYMGAGIKSQYDTDNVLELYLRQSVAYSVLLHHWLFLVFVMKQERKSFKKFHKIWLASHLLATPTIQSYMLENTRIRAHFLLLPIYWYSYGTFISYIKS